MDQFLLTDAQFERIALHLPTDTRVKERADDRRMISGVVQVLKSGGRWSDASRETYRPKKTLYNRFVRCADKLVWTGLFETLAQADGPPARVLLDSSAMKAHRSAAGDTGGEHTRAIGRSRGGRTTTIHPLSDQSCRPLALMLTSGQVAVCTASALLLKRLPTCTILLADNGYDSDAIRRQIEAAGAATNIPPEVKRHWKPCFSPVLYRGRNAIKRMFNRLKDFRRVATRYDRLDRHLLRLDGISRSLRP